ncbi:MAG: ATP-dependent RNA helicase DbpA [Pseudomonadales bacterium]|nr:ATP-dependent RNA helicase DbpA [Pseudomonadales bacterium]
MNPNPFSTLPLQTDLLQTLDRIGFAQMTPIQQLALPVILQGKDIIAQAQTGSGKTAAFALGILQSLEVSRFRIQALVLCPTRELADQVANDIRTLGSSRHNIKVLTLCGGVPIGPQIGSLQHGAHIIVATPGRLIDHLDKGRLDFSSLRMLVLDEADRMLDMGFSEALQTIVATLPAARQTLLFSATYSAEVQKTAESFLQAAQHITVQTDAGKPDIAEFFYPVGNEQARWQALQLLLLQYQPDAALVFCTTRQQTQTLADTLGQAGFSALPLHGDLEQRQRDQSLILFNNGSINILVATDVAARGLDIEAMDLVINYQPANDPDVYTHRIGRTGRAGRKGVACTLFSAAEAHKLARLPDRDPLQNPDSLPDRSALARKPRSPQMQTLEIAGGKKDKLRAGDIVGALTRDNAIQGSDIGRITVNERRSFVAVRTQALQPALTLLAAGIKGRSFRARVVNPAGNM